MGSLSRHSPGQPCQALDARRSAWFTRSVAKRGRDKVTVALLAIAVGVWLVAGYFFWIRQPSNAAAPPPPTPSSDPSNDPASAPPPPANEPPASARPATAPPPDVDACVKRAFAPDSLGSASTPTFGFVCDETNPLKAGTEMRARLLLAAGRGVVTPAMRLWAGLGWYEMAALSLLRAHCCGDLAPLTFHFKLACPIDEALARWETVIRTGDRAQIDAAVDDYHQAVRCLSQFGQSQNFGRDAPPGADITPLREIIARMFPL